MGSHMEGLSYLVKGQREGPSNEPDSPPSLHDHVAGYFKRHVEGKEYSETSRILVIGEVEID